MQNYKYCKTKHCFSSRLLSSPVLVDCAEFTTQLLHTVQYRKGSKRFLCVEEPYLSHRQNGSIWELSNFHTYHRGFHEEPKRVPQWRQAKKPFQRTTVAEHLQQSYFLVFRLTAFVSAQDISR